MKIPASKSALALLERTLTLKTRKSKKKKASYRVPSLWTSEKGKSRAVKVDPYAYYLKIVRDCRRLKPVHPKGLAGGEWSREAVVYNMFVRTTTAFDHNGNGKLDLPVNHEGFRETGTFLKALAMLPYIKRLGATVIHLLPITSIGHDGNKGNLGSPYAIRNPYELDENLAEPALELDVKTEFKAFVEAAHAMGFRVIVEFVFRTTAKDGDWVKERPEWFYWIKEEIRQRNPGEQDESSYGSPLFTTDELRRIHDDVNNGRFGQLPEPHPQYKSLFTDPPDSNHVKKMQGRYVGTLPSGQRVKIPGAFADWPPDDNQPPWDDVTYLRMYTNPQFNYIAYNTLRMYDSRFAHEQHINKPLWERITGIIPYYAREFGIDGVMIDMGHALPMQLKAEMIRSAHDANPDFAFWDENFSISMGSREEGYNAVIGYLWHVQHVPQYMKEFGWRLHNESLPLPFFATPESHNTHRAAVRKGGVLYSRWAAVVNAFLPGIPFIHSGYEIAETYPINTGLDFSREELSHMPSETLPLFSEFAFDWTRSTQFVPFLAKLLKLRKAHKTLVINADHSSFHMHDTGNPSIFAYSRVGGNPYQQLAILTNMDFEQSQPLSFHMETRLNTVVDLLNGKRYRVKAGVLEMQLLPGQGLVFEY